MLMLTSSFVLFGLLALSLAEVPRELSDPEVLRTCQANPQRLPVCPNILYRDLSPGQVAMGYCEGVECTKCKYVRNTCETGCEDQTKDIVVNYNLKLVTFVHGGCTNWQLANETCCNVYGGRLWQPRTQKEYLTVIGQVQDVLGELSQACRWWIGVNNWSSDQGTLPTITTGPPPALIPLDWMEVTDGHDGNSQNCVDIRGPGPLWTWGDENCKCTLQKFVCESGGKGDLNEWPADKIKGSGKRVL